MAYSDKETGLVEDGLIKLYYEDLARLKSLTANQRNILDAVFGIVGKNKYSNQIQLTQKVKNDIATYAGCKVSSVNMAFTVFCKKDIVQKEANTIYMVNPDLVYKGKQNKRARVIIDYYENRRVIKVEEVL